MNSDNPTHSEAVGRLRETVARLGASPVHQVMISARDGVLARFGHAFSLDHLPALDKHEFLSFLSMDNNHHWSGLNRMGHRAAEDMDTLRAELAVLLDESQPLAPRFTRAVGTIPGVGKALATAILTVTYPGKYGVWNNTSEAGLLHLGIWPSFARGDDLGRKYEKVNGVLTVLASELGIDFWTLDALWWRLLDGDPLPVVVGDGTVSVSQSTALGRVALEAHLQQLLVDNWERTELAHEWMIYSPDGDADAGVEFPTAVGRIDILAKHRHEPRWLVVELKRGRTRDRVVGQTLRYMGWVKSQLAKDSERVEGLIVAFAADDSLRYALQAADNVSLMLYDFQIRLYRPDTN